MHTNNKVVDKYEFSLNDKLGEGSFGQVFKAKDTKTNEWVAIKMLAKNRINQHPYLREALTSEINIMKKLKGKNVVRLLDVLETQNNIYIVQEFCEGGDLQRYLKKKGQLDESEAIKVLIDILVGFSELLKHGIIHRDLKPANILIDKGVYKLADFGFAKCISNFSNEMLQTSVGTPLYMAPQILMNQRYRTKSDIWSIGIIFYELMDGKTPWNAISIPQLLNNIQKIPIRFDQIPISKHAREFIFRCLQFIENDRMNWREVYEHPLFGDTLKQYLNNNQKIEAKVQFIINDIRFKVAAEQIELDELFKKYVSINKTMNLNNMENLLKAIDKDINRDEVEYVFNLLDTNRNNTVDFSEFYKFLQQNQVRLSFKQKMKEAEIINSPDIQGVKQNNTKPLQILQGLQSQIKQNDISVVKLFKALDRDNNQALDLQEFSVLLKKIDNKISETDTLCVFQMFDKNKSGYIAFQEFRQTIENQISYQDVIKLKKLQSS